MSTIIYQWLDRIGLSHVVKNFEDRGINSPHALMKVGSLVDGNGTAIKDELRLRPTQLRLRLIS